jgi:hypothetical protein
MSSAHTSIYDLPFSRVMSLFKIKESAEQRNDIRMRAKLLAHYPELFDPQIWSEISTAYQQASHFTTASTHKPAKFISFEEYRNRITLKPLKE